jgi:hypothetical protein
MWQETRIPSAGGGCLPPRNLTLSYFVERQKVSEALKGFQQDKENDSQWYALSDRMGEIKFFGCRGKNFVQFFFRERAFQTRICGIVNARHSKWSSIKFECEKWKTDYSDED